MMTQWLRLLAIPAGKLSSVLSIHVGWLITTWKSSSEGCSALFWLLQVPTHRQHLFLLFPFTMLPCPFKVKMILSC